MQAIEREIQSYGHERSRCSRRSFEIGSMKIGFKNIGSMEIGSKIGSVKIGFENIGRPVTKFGLLFTDNTE